MDAQERLVSVLDEHITEEVRSNDFELQQLVSDTIEWIIDMYEIESDEDIASHIKTTETFLSN